MKPPFGTWKAHPGGLGASCHPMSYQCTPHCHCFPHSRARSGTGPQAPATRRQGCSASVVYPRSPGWSVHGRGRFQPLLPTLQVQGECQGSGPSRAQSLHSAGRTLSQTPGPHRSLGCGKLGRGHGGLGAPRSNAQRSASQHQMPGL